MNTVEEFSKRIGIDKQHLINLSNRVDRQYKSYWVPKKSGQLRGIEAPNKELKGVQRWLLKNFLETFTPHECAHGFIPERGIRTNAQVHLGSTMFLCMDIENFFPSISMGQYYNFFKSKGISDELNIVISNMMSYESRLPQGGPCSPYLSNLIMIDYDKKISDKANSFGVIYTRYADDMTFSCDDIDKLRTMETFILDLFKDGNFKIKTEKTRYYQGEGRSVVTGINMNDGKRLTISQKKKKTLKAMLHNHIVKKEEINIKQMIGLYHHIVDVQPDYKDNLKAYVQKLKSKSK